MNPAYIQGTSANLVAVIDGRDADAIAIFFTDNRLIRKLIRKYGGVDLSEETREQIYNEVCIQVLSSRSGSYDPSYAPSTYLKYPVLEASRAVKREQLAGGVTARSDKMIVFDEFEDETQVDECRETGNVGARPDDLEKRIDAAKLLSVMPPDLAELMILVHWYGFSFSEACTKLGLERTSGYRKVREFRRRLN